MGKDMWSEDGDEQLEDNHPGCMWGILQALDYHHWHYDVKKMLPHRKHNGPRHAKGNGRTKARLNYDEVQKLLDAEASHILVNKSTTKTSSTNKRSLTARIKALISEEISKEASRRRRGSGFPTQSRLQRTFSIHHLEPSDNGPHGKSTGWTNPIVFLHSNADNDTSPTRLQDQGHMKGTENSIACNENFNVASTNDVLDYLKHKQLVENHTICPEKFEKARENSANKKHMETNQHSGNASHYQCKENADVLEIFRVNKDLFLKILQNTDDGMQAKLTKSGSFPFADLSRSRNFRPSKLKNKQNEVWSFSKGEKMFSGTQATKLAASKFPKDLCTKSVPLMADDSGGEVPNQDAFVSSMGSTQELDKRGSNEVVQDSLYEIKLGMEQAVREHKDNSSSCQETDGSVHDLSKGTTTHIRRTSSLNESLERYAQLFENTFSREAKLHLSRSLKLTNEYEISSSGHAPIFFKRVRSLPHLDSNCSLQNGLSCDAHFSGIPIRTVVENSKNVESVSHNEPKPVVLPISTENYIPLSANEEIECFYNMVERSDSNPKKEHLDISPVQINEQSSAKIFGLGEERNGQTVWESNLDKEQEITLAETASYELPQPNPVSVLQSCFQEDGTIPADFPSSEGLECTCNYVERKESSVDSQYKSCSDSLSWSCSTAETVEIANKSDKDHRHIEFSTNENADYNYVREILEWSGFDGNGFLGPWYSLDQPLNPLVLEELEACWPHEPQCSGEGEEICACCRHQLLFDLVDEGLIQIYDSSVTYYPRALSFNCHIRRMPAGYHVLEEVWTRISRTLSLRPEVDQSLDCVVARDLGKDDGWMNLQLESECVALELEDLIFDELLEELTCS